MLNWSGALSVLTMVTLLGSADPSGHGLWERTVRVMDDLAVQIQDRGRLADAERLYNVALGLCEAGETVPVCRDYGRLLNNLGSLYYTTHRLPAARARLELAVRTLRSDGSAIDLSSALANLAATFRAMGRYREALPLYEEAIAIRDRELGKGNPRSIVLMSNLALLEQDLGDPIRAEQLARRAVELSASADAPDRAPVLAALGSVLRGQGRLAEAVTLYQQALALRERAFGFDDMRVAETLNGLGQVLRLQGRLEQAELVFRRAMAILREPAPSRLMIGVMNNLAQTLLARGHWREAEPLYRRALDVSLQLNGEMHPETAFVMVNLGRLAAQRHRNLEAEQLLGRGLELLNTTLGSGHPESGAAAASLADVCVARKDMACADRYYEQAVRALSAARHPQLARVLAAYAAVLRAREKFAEAARVDAQATGALLSLSLH